MQNIKHILITVKILFVFTFFIFGCGKESGAQRLQLSGEFNLEIPEPSGLTFASGKTMLWTVSDADGCIYKISLNGKIEQVLDINGDDLEGITLVHDSILAVVEERTREILLFDLLGNEISRHKINISGESNNGLEGITFNKNNNHFYVVNEKYPRLLLELDENFEIINEVGINFALDLSGIFYEESENVLWILSDESRLIGKCDLSGKLLQTYKINALNPEGIAVDQRNKKIYIVSDRMQKLYVYELE